MRVLRAALVLIGLVTLLIAGVMGAIRHGEPPPSWIVFSSDRGGSFDLYRMRPDGSDLQQLTDTPEADYGATISPNGKWIAFLSYRETLSLFRLRMNGTAQQHLMDGSRTAVWSPDSAGIVFVSDRDGTWDLYRMQVTGATWQKLTATPGQVSGAAWSPDGQWIVFASDQSGDWELYRIRPDGTDVQQLTESLGDDSGAAWSPDGQWIVFVSGRHYNPELYRMRPDGSDQRRITTNRVLDITPRWSPDGQWIVFYSIRRDEQDLYRIRPDGSDEQRLTDNPGEDQNATWSPDGAWLVYESDRDGNRDIYRMRADGSDQQRLTRSPAVDMEPHWSPSLASQWRAVWTMLIGAVLVIAGTVRWRGRVQAI